MTTFHRIELLYNMCGHYQEVHGPGTRARGCENSLKRDGAGTASKPPGEPPGQVWRAWAPAERLLLFEVKQGWGPLCDFLEVPEPSEEFPHVNDTAATQALIKAAMENGIENIYQ
jgi:hypothetical protein